MKNVIYFLGLLLILFSCQGKNDLGNIPTQKTDERINPIISNAIEEKLGSPLLDEPAYWRYRKILPLPNQKVLSREYLTSTYWVLDPDVNPYVLILFYNDNVILGGTRQSGINLKGTYTIQNDIVYISITYISHFFIEFFGINNSIQLLFDKDYEGLFFKQRMRTSDEGIALYPEGLNSTINKIYTYKNIEVRKLEYFIVTTDNLNLRKGPGKKYERIDKIYSDYNILGSEVIDYLIPGHPLKVIAESDQEYTIGDFNGKWLTVEYPVYEAFANLWIFGYYTKKISESEFREYQMDLPNKLKSILNIEDEM